MINLIEVRTSQGALLGLPLDDVSNGVVVDKVEGLDPVKATLVSSSFAQLDGAQYQSARRDPRNIVLTLGLEPDYAEDTVRTLRKRLYSFFMPKSEVALRFYLADGLDVEIMARVESFEADIFTAEPNAVISLMAFDPDFYELVAESIPGETTSSTVEFTVEYDGTVETGILLTLNVNRALGAFTIYHTPPDGTLRQLDFDTDLVNGDVLKISTVPGSKYATLTRGGVDSSILFGISPQSKWLELLPGQNKLRVYATGAAVPFTIAFTNKYGGL